MIMQVSSNIVRSFGNPALSLDSVKKYRAVLNAVRGGNKIASGETYSPTKALTSLKEAGRLEPQRDSEGETLLDNLHDLSSAAKDTERRELLNWSLIHLAHPDETFHQLESKTTCVPTTLAYDLMVENPAEFVRLVDGLSSPKGEVTLANGDVLSDPGFHDETPDSGGSPIEKLLQASLMNFGKPELTYNLNDDKFGDDPSAGLLAGEVEKLVDAITGKDHDWFVPTLAEFEKSLKSTDNTIPTVLKWDEPAEETEDGGGETIHSHHMVLATDIDEDFVYIRNPWGTRLANDQHLDVGREVLEDGMERFPKDKFYELMTYAVLPTAEAAKEIRAERGLANPEDEINTANLEPATESTSPKKAKILSQILFNWFGRKPKS